MNFLSYRNLWITICLGFTASVSLAQQAVLASFDTSPNSVSEATVLPVMVAVTPSTKPAHSLTARWLDMNTLVYGARYRNTVNGNGRRTFQFGQEHYIADGRFKFDAQGRYAIGFHASSGRYFNWSYADFIGGQYKDAVVAARAYKTPAQRAALKKALKYDPNSATYKSSIPSRGGYFNFRQLYASLSPIKQITFEVGSLPIEHGENTEITSFDDDGYISGERLRISDPKHLFFDQIAATSAYMGSPLTPSFFARGGDLKRSNYTQYLAQKKFGADFAASFDFTRLNGTHTMREAIAVKLPHAIPVNGVRLELYQRLNTVQLAFDTIGGAPGLAISANKVLLHRLDFSGGYASIDAGYGVYSGSIYLQTVGFAWNGDSYSFGDRGFARADLKLFRGVTGNGFYTHTTKYYAVQTSQQGYSAGLSFDINTIANTTKQIF